MKNARAVGLSFSEVLMLPHHWLASIQNAPNTAPPSKPGEKAVWSPGTLYDAERVRALKQQYRPAGGA